MEILAFVEYTSLCIISTFALIPVDLIGDKSGYMINGYGKVTSIHLSIDTLDAMPSYYDVTQTLSLLISWVSTKTICW